MSGPYHIKDLAATDCAYKRCATIHIVQQWVEQGQRLHKQTMSVILPSSHDSTRQALFFRPVLLSSTRQAKPMSTVIAG